MKLGNVITVIAVALIATGCASTGPSSGQSPKTGSPLPAEIEGVERLADNALRTKPGFEWVKQPDGTVMARKVGATGGGLVIIRVGCGCDTGPYACEAVLVDDTTIRCQNVRDCLSCKWFRPDAVMGE